MFNKNLQSLEIQEWLDHYKTKKSIKFGVIGGFLIMAYFSSSFIIALLGLVLGYFAYNDKVDDSCLEEDK